MMDDFDEVEASLPVIKIIGIGSGGINAINHMIASNLQKVDFIVADTDAEDLAHAQCEKTIQLGVSVTQGHSCGAKFHTGSEAAVESIDAIKAALNGADLIFVLAGMGGGAGSGAAPVIAEVAKELGALTIGVVMKPFYFEGKKRLETAEVGIQALLNAVDSLIIIPSDRLIGLVPKKAFYAEILKIADGAMHLAVRSISDVLVHQSLVGVDFADIQTIFKGKGKAAMGFGAASGESRARDAAERAITSPLLAEFSLADASSAWFNITSNEDVTLEEVSEAAEEVMSHAHEDALICFGTRFDDSVGDELRVTVIAAGAALPEKPTSDKGDPGTDAKSATPEDDIFTFDEDDFDIPAFTRRLSSFGELVSGPVPPLPAEQNGDKSE